MSKFVGIAEITFANGMTDNAVMPKVRPDGTESHFDSREEAQADMERAFSELNIGKLMDGMKVYTAEVTNLVEFIPNLTGTMTVAEAVADEESEPW